MDKVALEVSRNNLEHYTQGTVDQPEMLSRGDVQTLRSYKAEGLDIQVRADDHDSMDRLRYV